MNKKCELMISFYYVYNFKITNGIDTAFGFNEVHLKHGQINHRLNEWIASHQL